MKFLSVVVSYLALFGQGNIVSGNEVADSAEVASLENDFQQVEAGIRVLRDVLLRDPNNHKHRFNLRKLASLTSFSYSESTLNMQLDNISGTDAITMLSCAKDCMSGNGDVPTPPETSTPTYLTESPTSFPSSEPSSLPTSLTESPTKSTCSSCDPGTWGFPGDWTRGTGIGLDDGKCNWFCSSDKKCGFGPHYQDGGTDCRENLPPSPDPKCSYPCWSGLWNVPGWGLDGSWNSGLQRSDGRCEFFCSRPDPNGISYCGVGPFFENGGTDCRE